MQDTVELGVVIGIYIGMTQSTHRFPGAEVDVEQQTLQRRPAQHERQHHHGHHLGHLLLHARGQLVSDYAGLARELRRPEAFHNEAAKRWVSIVVVL